MCCGCVCDKSWCDARRVCLFWGAWMYRLRRMLKRSWPQRRVYEPVWRLHARLDSSCCVSNQPVKRATASHTCRPVRTELPCCERGDAYRCISDVGGHAVQCKIRMMAHCTFDSRRVRGNNGQIRVIFDTLQAMQSSKAVLLCTRAHAIPIRSRSTT